MLAGREFQTSGAACLEALSKILFLVEFFIWVVEEEKRRDLGIVLRRMSLDE